MRNLKNYLIVLCACTAIGFLSSCAALISTPTGPAGLYANVTYPSPALAVECKSDIKRDNVGQSSATNILGIINTGDISIEAAMKNGKITKIHHVDMKTECVLGLYAKKTIIVYGE
jgi:hypothetical protein